MTSAASNATAGTGRPASQGRQSPAPTAPPPHEPGPLQGVGSGFLGISSSLGSMGILGYQIVRRLISLDFDRGELVKNLYKMGVKSVPIVILTALFTGAIVVIQAAPLVVRLGAHGLLGWGAGFSILREIAPLLTALMINGRVGANNTAELGTMVVTEQIDALRVLAIDPISFLIAPRFLAMVITLFLSTIFADALALLGAAYGGLALLNVDPKTFYNGLTGSELLGVSDVTSGLVKSIVFGIVMGLSSCQYGLGVKGGAPGVGRAVNATVVASAAGIFVLDYFVSFTLD
jgi:phospholipid/cholesterol/gamma-HCH transport system permease protein